jgi:hypothetical protein
MSNIFELKKPTTGGLGSNERRSAYFEASMYPRRKRNAGRAGEIETGDDRARQIYFQIRALKARPTGVSLEPAFLLRLVPCMYRFK